MPEELSKLPKPQMRRLLYGQIRKNLILTGISVTIAGLYMRLVFGDGNKREYAEFYKNYDINKEFHRIRRKGLFDSCDPNDDAE
ncbi:hypothetical protein Zmor_020438 [Zophobas morio]|uniref:Mitochondrial cytochrome c oxidase subunit VIc/VIIs domain-containing protein n=1 Tax=Zophobas morio TaxID=2755281 RepID=A0AA38M9M3_9CUCU|nr:hypothetical protein Zmor_020438 [Zophobas morio]